MNFSVSKNLEIKELSTGIEMNYQGDNNENNNADENMDIAGAPPHAAHEDSVSVEPQAQTEQITANKIIRHKSKKDRGCIGGCNVSMSRL